ncbi:MAG: VWA domain-containing protein [candidate division KSB1 bacterium]|nr:VWA domain-containing protein [candidate division KSB1 bacterium]
MRPPVSVVLVMDYSGSMGGYESTVEAASLAFLSNLQAGDRVGIVHFRGGVTIVSSLTSDLARVAASIPGHAATGFTAMYDGLYTAIGMLAGIDGPKIIVLYTDGWDNASHWTPSDVVTLAREAGVSIYCLGIGSDVDQRSLTSIASSTGGMAEFGLDVQSLYQFYDKILSLISSYYWLAYCSPDPEFNCSWRVLDVSVQLYAAAGRDTAHYLAPCGGPDASIWKHAVVDSYYVSPSVGDTIGFVASGETFTYIIRVRNAGGDFHMGSEVFDVLPPGYVLMEASPPPTEARGDTLMWRVPALRAADTWAATLRLKAEYDPYRTSTRFVNVAWIANDEDTVLVNNRAADTLYALPPEPIPPEIMVAPPVIEPRDSVTVTILTHIPAVRWWVEVELGDGSKIFDYPRRPLRDSTELVAGTPFTLPEKFVRTQLVTRGERERLRFWVVIEDPLGRTLRSRPADVIIRGANNVLLSRNVFRPGRDPNLIVRLKLSSNRTATVKILDISGRVVVVLAQDQFFLAGWNEIAWDGRDSHGNLVGPGIYVLTVESDPIREWLKFVIIR